MSLTRVLPTEADSIVVGDNPSREEEGLRVRADTYAVCPTTDGCLARLLEEQKMASLPAVRN